MRGKRYLKLGLMLLPAALLGAGAAAAQAAPPSAPQTGLPTAVVVLDASSSMNAKAGGARKIDSVRAALGQAVETYSDRLSFGLVAFGHRKASNCADSEILAKPGELTAETQSHLLEKIKPKGQAPIAAALTDAASGAPAQDRLDIVLIADGGDSCDADACSTAVAMKEKSPSLRVHVIGFGNKQEDLKPLSCLAGTTGGTFVVAANADELKQGLAAILDTAAASPQPPPQTVARDESAAPPPAVALLPGMSTVQPLQFDTPPVRTPPRSAPSEPQEPAPQPEPNAAPAQTPPQSVETEKQQPAVEPEPSATRAQTPPQEAAAETQQPAAETESPSESLPEAKGAGETAVQKSASPPPNRTAAVEPKSPAQSDAVQNRRPVPVTFKALVSEGGPRLQSGLIWRVYESKASLPNARYKLVSTHRDAMPTAALFPGEYLVNAAYGLSNLTKKIKVESGHSLEETFVLNTGGLKLAAVLPSGDPLPTSPASYDILSDEADQFGHRKMVLRNAKPGTVIRLNAGAYHIECLYGDANATVKADVTVEPGKITEATLKQTGAKTTFKLVQSLGGEALADTKWTILTSAGDVVKENAGALPTHILAPGSYSVIADHAGLNYTRTFSIGSGEAKQVEVVIDDGPTSPEALKALTDPPELPPPSSGEVVAGDGAAPSPNAGAAFDGLSPAAPADPNAPLINPGVLLRTAP
jgi:hypothetical protein